MIIDLDSHLRDGYFLDEIYRLAEPYAEFSPVRIGDGQYQKARFRHSLTPTASRPRRAFSHDYIYDPDFNWQGGEVARRQVGGYDMEYRLEDIAREGLDRQVVFPTQISIPTQNQGGLCAALSRAYNDWVTRLVRGYEDRLWPVAMAPAGFPEAMAGELKRCVEGLGFKASHLVPYCGDRNLDDPEYYPYYQVAQDLGVPLFCHPNSNGDLTDRFNSFFPMHVLGRPMNCTPALVALVCGGVFERFPGLKVAFFECSSEWVLYWMHRMDDDYEWAKETEQLDLTMPPSEYVRRNCYVTCEADERDLRPAIAELGEDRILLATDYPHFDSEFPHTVSKIRARADITDTQKDLILGGNAAKLLNL